MLPSGIPSCPVLAAPRWDTTGREARLSDEHTRRIDEMIARLEALLVESAGLKAELARDLVRRLTAEDLLSVESHMYPPADRLLATKRKQDP